MDDSVSFIAKEASPAQYSHSLHERTHSEKQKRDFTITEKQDEVSGQTAEPRRTDSKSILQRKCKEFFDSFKRQLPPDRNSELESQEKKQPNKVDQISSLSHDQSRYRYRYWFTGR